MHYRPKLYQDEGKPLNHGKPWTSKDILFLQESFSAGGSLLKTADRLHRRVSACLIKLESLHLLEESREYSYTRYVVRYGFANANWKPDSPIYDELDEVPKSLLIKPNTVSPEDLLGGTIQASKLSAANVDAVESTIKRLSWR